LSNRNRPWKSRAHDAPAEIFERALRGDDDDVRKSSNPRADHKTMQLCRQVQRALMLALAGECADEVLRDLYVESVEPMGSASQLLVQVALPRGSQLNYLDVLARLNDRAPRLRAIVAQSICRKRVPNLSFVATISPDGGQP